MICKILLIVCCVTVVTASVACDHRAPTASPRVAATASAPAALSPYDRALIEFEAAIFFKPRDDPATRRPPPLAPLIMQEAPPGTTTAPAAARFGALRVDAAGRLEVDVSRSAVYTRSSEVTLHGTTYDQIVYAWWYPANADLDAISWRAVRMTFNADGMPAIWEFLHDGAATPLVFVSRSVEQAALETHGPPAPGRRFSVEPADDAYADVIVARVLSDGPVPMGPFVYLDEPHHTVTTLLCRCMAAQTDDVVDSVYYDLTHYAELPPPVRAAVDAPPYLVSKSTSDTPTGTDPTWLETALRLPARL